MRGAAVVTLALTLTCSAIPAAAQQPREVKPDTHTARDAGSKTLGTRSVTGTVKQSTENGLVVMGRETGQKDKEWAFAFDPATRIDAGGTARMASDLREGEAVTVTYTSRDGKVVAQRVTVSAR